MVEMKESGITWCGDIPAHWQIMANKYIMLKKKEICPIYKGQDILSLTMNGVIVRNLEAGGKMPTSFDGYQKIYPNNLLMCLFDYDVTPRCIGLIKNEGLTSPAYSQFIMKNENSSRYYYYYYLMIDNTKELLHLAKNLRHSFTEDQLGAIKTPVPPLDEQNKIADFLDSKCAEIDAISSEIQEQINTLEEYKKSVISDAVTKGLNPNAEMKDSGIEWIGDIPKDWDVTKIKYNALIKGRIGFRGYTEADLVDEGEGAITLSPSNFLNMKMNYDKCSYISWFKYNESPEIKIYNDDILFVKTGSSYGKSCLVKDLPMEATINPQLIVFKDVKINNNLLAYILQTEYIISQSELAVVGGTIPTMSQNKIGNFNIVVPTSEEEQSTIVEFLNERCSKIDGAIEDKQKQFETLEDYKKTLIYEYVTGKKVVA